MAVLMKNRVKVELVRQTLLEGQRINVQILTSIINNSINVILVFFDRGEKVLVSSV
jgi:hypothetical protein